MHGVTEHTKKGIKMERQEMADKVISTEYVRALIYGDAGSGKTHFLRGVPRPLVVFDFDGKLKPLYGEKGISAISCSPNSESLCSIAHNSFLSAWKEVVKDTSVKSIAIDTITSMDIVCMKH